MRASHAAMQQRTLVKWPLATGRLLACTTARHAGTNSISRPLSHTQMVKQQLSAFGAYGARPARAAVSQNNGSSQKCSRFGASAIASLFNPLHGASPVTISHHTLSRILHSAAMLALATGLSACGGSDSDGQPPAPPPPQAPTPTKLSGRHHSSGASADHRTNRQTLDLPRLNLIYYNISFPI